MESRLIVTVFRNRINIYMERRKKEEEEKKEEEKMYEAKVTWWVSLPLTEFGPETW